jgi:tryptophan-rich sensory protein
VSAGYGASGFEDAEYMTGTLRPILMLAWFEGVVVSLGAVSGIISAPGAFPFPDDWPLLIMPATLDTLGWLLAFVVFGWLGWRTHTRRPQGAAFTLWTVQFVLLLAWRPMVFLIHAIWPGTMTLIFALVASAFMMPLVASFSLAATWICLPLLLWLGYCSVSMLVFAVIN